MLKLGGPEIQAMTLTIWSDGELTRTFVLNICRNKYNNTKICLVVDLLPATVKAYMDLVIAKNLFASSGGDLVAVKDITIVDTTTQDLYDVPIV